MKILHKNLKKQEVKLQVENQEDLWYLSGMIDPGDLVRGYTLRKIKIGGDDQRKAQVKRKRVRITVQAEKIDYKPDMLKVLGIITEGPDDVQRGTHHTFTLEENTTATIIKQRWLKYQLDRLNEAATVKLPKILIVVHDRESAFFARLKRNNYEVLSSFHGSVQKKADNVQATGNFYVDVIKQITEYDLRYKLDSIVIASPAFFKEDLMKNLGDKELKKKIVLATCSSATENAFKEVLKRNEVKDVLRKDRISKEIVLVDELLGEISKAKLAAYGLGHTKETAEAGAVKSLLISDGFIQTMKEKDKYAEIDSIMKIVEQTRGVIHIISSDNDAGKSLDGLGGIAAILRYSI